METSKHISVLLQPTVTALNISPGGVYIDTTLGGAGHTRKILEQMKFRGKLLVIDSDPEPISNFRSYLLDLGFEVQQEDQPVAGLTHLHKEQLDIYMYQGNFSELKTVIKMIKLPQVNGIVADLGLSTDQLLDGKRGFSYLSEGKLDMRMNPALSVTAADLINGLYQGELETLFTSLGDIDFASKLARAVIRARKFRPILTVRDLKQLVQKIVPSGSRLGANKHPEAKVFQALRIAVNDELGSLKQFLPQALEALAPGGRMGVITFHSGEDRIVKNFFRDQVTLGKAQYIFKLLKPDTDELADNQRSHSAKLRAISKI